MACLPPIGGPKQWATKRPWSWPSQFMPQHSFEEGIHLPAWILGTSPSDPLAIQLQAGGTRDEQYPHLAHEVRCGHEVPELQVVKWMDLALQIDR